MDPQDRWKDVEFLVCQHFDCREKIPPLKYQAHLKLKHPPKKPVKNFVVCSTCENKFQSQTSLDKHAYIQHIAKKEEMSIKLEKVNAAAHTVLPAVLPVNSPVDSYSTPSHSIYSSTSEEVYDPVPKGFFD